MFNYFKSAWQEILDALKAWDNRKEQSIKAVGSTPVYDRYDPKYGLHDEPKVEEEKND